MVRDEVLFLQAALKLELSHKTTMIGHWKPQENHCNIDDYLSKGEDTPINTNKGYSAYFNRISGAVAGGSTVITALGITGAAVSAPVALALVAGGTAAGFYYGYRDESLK